jgi:hypothetical protein
MFSIFFLAIQIAMGFVANPNLCKNCHTKQYDFWEKTPHSSAYLILYSKNEHINPECITCHTLGYQKSGGFDKILKPLVLTTQKPGIEEIMKTVFPNEKSKTVSFKTNAEEYKKIHKKYWDEINQLYSEKKITKNFLGVQCEHCHGNREEHIQKVGLKLKVPAKNQCVQCHTPPNAEPVTKDMIKKMSCPK